MSFDYAEDFSPASPGAWEETLEQVVSERDEYAAQVQELKKQMAQWQANAMEAQERMQETEKEQKRTSIKHRLNVAFSKVVSKQHEARLADEVDHELLKNREIEQKMSNVESEKHMIEEEAKGLQARLEDLQDENQKMQQEILRLQQALSIAEETVQKFQVEVQALKDELEEASLQASMQSFSLNPSLKQAFGASARRKKSTFGSSGDSLQLQLALSNDQPEGDNDVGEDLVEGSPMNTTLSGTAGSLLEELVDTAPDEQERINELQDKCTAEEERIEELERTDEELKKRVAALESTNEQLQQELSKALTENSSVSQQQPVDAGFVERARYETRELEMMCEHLEDSVVRARDQSSVAARSAEKANQESREFHKQLEELVEKARLDEEANAQGAEHLQRECRQLNQQVEELKASELKAHDLLEERWCNNEELMQKCASLQEKVDREHVLHECAGEWQNECEARRRECQEVREEAVGLRVGLENMREEVSEARKKEQDACECQEHCETQLQKMTQELHEEVARAREQSRDSHAVFPIGLHNCEQTEHDSQQSQTVQTAADRHQLQENLEKRTLRLHEQTAKARAAERQFRKNAEVTSELIALLANVRCAASSVAEDGKCQEAVKQRLAQKSRMHDDITEASHIMHCPSSVPHIECSSQAFVDRW